MKVKLTERQADTLASCVRFCQQSLSMDDAEPIKQLAALLAHDDFEEILAILNAEMEKDQK